MLMFFKRWLYNLNPRVRKIAYWMLIAVLMGIFFYKQIQEEKFRQQLRMLENKPIQ